MSEPRKEVLAEGVEIWLGDCREVMPMVGFVDAVITDPPYLGLKGGTVHLSGGVAPHKLVSVSVGDLWDASLDWCAEAERISKKCVAVFCSFSGVAEVKLAFSCEPVGLAVWHKRNAPLAVANVPRHTVEFIWLFKTGPNARWRSIKDTLFSVLSANAGCITSGERLVGDDGGVSHPTQKPVAIMEPFVSLVNEGERVCDPFMGTGTTGVACVNLGRSFIGIEREERYFDMARRRISEALRRPRLPFVEPAPQPRQEALL